MSLSNKVVWSEGLFLQPQHFQQQDRHFERYIQARCQALIGYSWGFTELELERDLLRIGKIGLRRVAGVFPDGTPFQMPDEDPLPAPIDVGAQVRDQLVSLSVPLRRAGEIELDRAADGDGFLRHEIRELQARDTASGSGTTALVEVAALRTRLLVGSDASDAYASLPIAHVVECRADQQVLLEDQFIPTVLHARAAPRLATLTTELLGMLHQRGEELGSRVMATGRGAAAEFADFLMLQAINRYEPLFAHYADTGAVHPEALYEACVTAAGDLATLTATSKRPPRFPGYRHEQLRESFEPVVVSLRKMLSFEIIDRVTSIPIEPKRFGVSVAIVADRTLYSTAVFVLAARADLPAEELRRRFPAQLRIGPSEKIGDLVRLQLPGVPVAPLPVAPRQIPFHAGYAYFELDQSSELWEPMKTSGALALHVAGEFPGLTMELWAIRG